MPINKSKHPIIGLIGGMSPEASLKYYELLIHLIPKTTGDRHTGNILLDSVDFDDILTGLATENWKDIENIVAEAYQQLVAAQANVFVICSNTIHKVVPNLEHTFTIPFIHIIEPVKDFILKYKMQRVGLLGTKFTMEDSFYREYLKKHNIDVIVPDKIDRDEVHRIIIEELTSGDFKSSYLYLKKLCEKVKDKGAEGIILGCTELPLILHAGDADIPLIDTIRLHVDAIIQHVYAQNKSKD